MLDFKAVIIPFLIWFFAWTLVGAQKSAGERLADVIYLDSIVVQATRSEFSVDDFIALVQEDESFYLAFRNLRFASYLMHTEMKFLDKQEQPKANYVANHRQFYDGRCRWMEVNSHEEGPFRKKKNRYRFYTAELFDRLFITHDTICLAMDIDEVRPMPSATGMEGHVGELKKLIFAPGSESKVPFIGSKSEIFSEKMLPRYNFSIESTIYEGVEAYVFQARIKSEYETGKFNKTLIKSLVTYFSKSDFQVLGRNYRLAQHAALYQFDVMMDIKLSQQDGRYFPKEIYYEGYWNIPTKKKEHGTFSIEISDFSFASSKN